MAGARWFFGTAAIAKVIESHTEEIEEGLMELRNSIESFVSDFE